MVNEVKNSASRVALPAASWAATTPAEIIANDIDREVWVIAFWDPWGR
jgi:hypothetical protein